MITELKPDLDRSISRRFGTMADEARVKRTAAALEANGISVLRAADAAEAKRIVLGLIPDGSEVYHGASESLEDSGITEEIEKSGRYEPVRPRIWSMDRADPGRRDPPPDRGAGRDARQRACGHRDRIAGCGLGEWQSARAVASGAGRVILVVGTQKIVSDLEEGLRRIDEYVFPLEDARAQAAYGVHSGVNKVLIINREYHPRPHHRRPRRRGPRVLAQRMEHATMATKIDTAEREVVLVEDAHIRPMMGLDILEPLPSARIPYSLVDPFILVHEGVVPITPEWASVDTSHPHRGFDNLWYVISGAASTGHSTGPGGAMERARLETGSLLKLRTGRGVWHAEGIGEDEIREGRAGSEMRGVLFWVNLARKDKGVEPSAQLLHPQDVPVRQEGDATVRVLVGEGSPVELGTPGLILDVELPKRRSLQQPGSI